MLTHSNIFIDVHRQAPIILLFYGFVCNIKQKYPVHVRFTRAELKDEKFPPFGEEKSIKTWISLRNRLKRTCKTQNSNKENTGNCIFPQQKKSKSGSQHVGDEGSRTERGKRIRKGIGQFGAYCNSKQKRNRKTQINDRLRSRPKEKHQKMSKLSVFDSWL